MWYRIYALLCPLVVMACQWHPTLEQSKAYAMKYYGHKPLSTLIANWGPPDKSIHGDHASVYEYRSKSRAFDIKDGIETTKIMTCRASVHTDADGIVTDFDLRGDESACEYLVPLGPEFSD